MWLLKRHKESLNCEPIIMLRNNIFRFIDEYREGGSTEKKKERQKMQNKQRYDNFNDPILVSVLLKRYLIKCNDTNGNPCLTSYREYKTRTIQNRGPGRRCRGFHVNSIPGKRDGKNVGQTIWLKINCQMLKNEFVFIFEQIRWSDLFRIIMLDFASTRIIESLSRSCCEA